MQVPVSVASVHCTTVQGNVIFGVVCCALLKILTAPFLVASSQVTMQWVLSTSSQLLIVNMNVQCSVSSLYKLNYEMYAHFAYNISPYITFQLCCVHNITIASSQWSSSLLLLYLCYFLFNSSHIWHITWIRIAIEWISSCTNQERMKLFTVFSPI